jgi:ubiquinone/menaquinone biosynthesis C-methylase UbiE
MREMNWHSRYVQQAGWTRDLRAYLLEKAGLVHARRVLEVGCGTGAILSTIAARALLYGVDIDPVTLAECGSHVPKALLTRGNGLALPYLNQTFDIVYCHYFLLWVHDPLQAVLEMKRVTKSGGNVIAFAEPDYHARLDQPDELQILGNWQREALQRRGADPGFGSRLAETFFQAGIKIIETGTIQNERNDPSAEEREMEWAVIEADLAGSVPESEIQIMKQVDQQAWKHGERVLQVPTYFAWGQRSFDFRATLGQLSFMNG